MNRRGLKWTAAGIVGLALVVLGVHLAWERQRYRLETHRGTLRIGMTMAETQEVLGPPSKYSRDGGRRLKRWTGKGFWVEATFGEDGRLANAWADDTSIPRPSFVEHVRRWFVSKRED